MIQENKESILGYTCISCIAIAERERESKNGGGPGGWRGREVY